jgi:transposase
VQLYRDDEGHAIAEVTRELDVGAETFRKWVRQDEADRGERGDKPTSVERAELARLRREKRSRAGTNEILKLAAGLFAQELDPTRRRP